VRAASLDVSAGSLSGGNQQKIIIARETRGNNCKFLICHHPTRGVDLGAIELIHREFLRLRNQGVSLLVISSDLEELMVLSDRIVVMFEGKTVKEFERGEYDSLTIGRYMTGALQ
jgi:simple sugar transport system ATP-binding protein